MPNSFWRTFRAPTTWASSILGRQFTGVLVVQRVVKRDLMAVVQDLAPIILAADLVGDEEEGSVQVPPVEFRDDHIQSGKESPSSKVREVAALCPFQGVDLQVREQGFGDLAWAARNKKPGE